MLTRRETDVAILIAGGLDDREIAATLCVSYGTVRSHISHILQRLGYRRRAQVAAYVGAMLALAQACG